MRSVLTLFWRIALFRAGPDQVPYSVALMAWLFFADSLLGWHQFAMRPSLNSSEALAQSVVLLVIIACFTYIVLQVKGYSARFLQTYTALLGINLLVNLFLWPIMLLLPTGSVPQDLHPLMTTALFFAVLYILFLNIWLITATAHIYAKAMDTDLLIGFLLSIALISVDILIFSQLFT